jgi:hypothetical protein
LLRVMRAMIDWARLATEPVHPGRVTTGWLSNVAAKVGRTVGTRTVRARS